MASWFEQIRNQNKLQVHMQIILCLLKETSLLFGHVCLVLHYPSPCPLQNKQTITATATATTTANTHTHTHTEVFVPGEFTFKGF